MIRYECELTDTFGGEANYAWCRRAHIEARADATDRALIRAAKRAVGLEGRHHKEIWGDTIAVRPVGACMVLFITAEA